jgi:uncharacterized protein DUF1569
MTHIGNPMVRQRILQRIAALKPDTERRWGRMTSHQMLCHLSDSYRVSMGEKLVQPAAGPLQCTFVKWIALYGPAPWPKGIRTRPEVEQGKGGTRPLDFRRDRADLIRVIELFADPNRQFEWRPHPVFGQLREREWLRWGFLHADHHLRQFGV